MLYSHTFTVFVIYFGTRLRYDVVTSYERPSSENVMSSGASFINCCGKTRSVSKEILSRKWEEDLSIVRSDRVCGLSVLFFYLLLGCPTVNFGPLSRSSLNNLMLITAFDT